MLAALPGRSLKIVGELNASNQSLGSFEAAPASVGSRGPLDWTMGGKKAREIGVGLLAWVDGVAYTSRWTRPVEAEPEPDDELERIQDSPGPDEDLTLHPNTPAPLENITPLTRTRKSSRRGRSSTFSAGEDDGFGPGAKN